MPKRSDPNKFPLWLHPRGLWCKKIRGKSYYFGRDKDEALKRYVAEKDDLEAGRKPRPRVESMSLADLAARFLKRKRERVESGELSARMWSDYEVACQALVDQFGGSRAASDLMPDDFGDLRARAAKRYGPVSLCKFINLTSRPGGSSGCPGRSGTGSSRPRTCGNSSTTPTPNSGP
jgi:hypothetical protein